MIRIIDAAEDRVKTIIVTLYGEPNIGKTSLSLTADKPILLDFDGGAYRAENRKGKPMVKVTSWKDVESMTAEDLAPYGTVIIDTVGTCLDQLSADIIRVEPKHGRGGTLTLQGYGVLKTRFRNFLTLVRTAGKDVVLLAHMSEESKGENAVERIIAPGASKQLVYQKSDLMGKMFIEGRLRKLSFDPTETSHGKNCGIEEMIVTPPSRAPDTLAKIITEAKVKINDKAMENEAEAQRLSDLTAQVSTMTTVDEFNEMVKKMLDFNAKPVDKKILMDGAEKLGFKFSKDTTSFENPAASPPEKPEGLPF